MVDFGIIVALPEEFRALREAFGGFKQVAYEGARTFYLRMVKAYGKPERQYAAVATFLNEMGQFDAVNATRDLLESWKPKHIIITGIAAGLHDKMRLGDVIVSNQILYYEPSKITDAGVEPRTRMYQVNALLLNRIMAFFLEPAAFRRWQKACKKPSGKQVGHWTGVFASGESVLASAAALESLRKINAKVAGAEMEAAGAFSAVFNCADPRRLIMVRGVSDRGDASKNKTDKSGRWRAAAAFNAAKLVEQFIRFGSIPPLHCDQIELNLSPRLTIKSRFSRTRGHSYPSFPRILIAGGPLLEVSLMALAWDENGSPLRIVRAAWTEFSSSDGGGQEQVITNNQIALSLVLQRKTFHHASLDLEIAGRLARFEICATTHTRKYHARYVVT